MCYGFEIGKRGSAELLFLCVRQGTVMGYGLWVIGYGLWGASFKFQIYDLGRKTQTNLHFLLKNLYI